MTLPSRITAVPAAANLLVSAPPQARDARTNAAANLIVHIAGQNVVTDVTAAAVLIVYKETAPALPRQDAWTFDLDGHRFYVLPLGEEGDWAYDFTTKQWNQLQTQGLNGINFIHGVMWGLRIMGGDALYNFLWEMDPNQPLDMAWKPVQHVVTGGLSTRGRNMIGCASFTITASPNDIQQAGSLITLNYSDDNGTTWSPDKNIALSGKPNQLLTWSALGSFAQPGRIFKVSDQAGAVRIDGADAALQNYNEDDEKGT